MPTYSVGDVCPKCGKPGVYVGDPPPQGWMKGMEPFCTCYKDDVPVEWYRGITYNISGWSNTGWICPRCNKVNAPHVNQCSCGPNIGLRTTSG